MELKSLKKLFVCGFVRSTHAHAHILLIRRIDRKWISYTILFLCEIQLLFTLVTAYTNNWLCNLMRLLLYNKVLSTGDLRSIFRNFVCALARVRTQSELQTTSHIKIWWSYLLKSWNWCPFMRTRTRADRFGSIRFAEFIYVNVAYSNSIFVQFFFLFFVSLLDLARLFLFSNPRIY